jgi:luciferase-like monooxygenase
LWAARILAGGEPPEIGSYQASGIHDLRSAKPEYDRHVRDVSAFADEIANELATWPGVRFEARTDGVTVVRYGRSELGLLYPERGVVELPVPDREHDILIEHGDAEPANLTGESFGVSHSIRGPADVTAVLALVDRRYRDLRGEDDPYSSEDPDYPHGRLDQL